VCLCLCKRVCVYGEGGVALGVRGCKCVLCVCVCLCLYKRVCVYGEGGVALGVRGCKCVLCVCFWVWLAFFV